MASKSVTARPAARRASQAQSKPKRTIAKNTASSKSKPTRAKPEPIVQLVARNGPKPAVELPKHRGELPVPTATFYF